MILTAGAAMLSGCVAVEASKPASGAVVVSDAAQKEGTLTVISSESVVVTPDMAEVVFGSQRRTRTRRPASRKMRSS